MLPVGFSKPAFRGFVRPCTYDVFTGRMRGGTKKKSDGSTVLISSLSVMGGDTRKGTLYVHAPLPSFPLSSLYRSFRRRVAVVAHAAPIPPPLTTSFRLPGIFNAALLS